MQAGGVILVSRRSQHLVRRAQAAGAWALSLGLIPLCCAALHASELTAAAGSERWSLPASGSAGEKSVQTLVEQAFLPTEWTTGHKKMLVIRVRYPDQPMADPISAAQLDMAWQQTRQQLPAYSSGLLSLEPQLVVTPTVTLPNPSTFYAGKIWSDELLQDARAAAAGVGAGYNPLYDSKFYALDAMVENVAGVASSASAILGGKGVYFTGGADKIQALAHEVGHNLGLSHVSWAVQGNATFGPLKPDAATLVEYGDNHDLMGNSGSSGGTPDYHFHPLQKKLLGWLSDSQFHTATSSGIYRIYAHDQPGLVAGQKVGLRVAHSPQEEVWYSFRQSWVSNPWSMNGAEMHIWNPWIHTYGGANPANTIRLDPRPATPQGIDDAALTIGRTFHDAYSDVYVTAVGKGGTQPESLDLDVRIGSTANNAAPTSSINASALAVAVGGPVTLTAVASDADGDPLAYAWEFGDGSFSSDNSAVVSKSWALAGSYRVSCIVSDRKGGESWKSLTLTVGAPSVGSISGNVTDAAGNPLAGVHVHNGLNAVGNAAYRGTYTADDGSFRLSNLAAGSYTLTAGKNQSVYSRVGGWNNPVQVIAAQDTAGRNFSRNSGLTSITGRVRAGPGGAFVGGVVVRVRKSDGSQLDLVSDASGLWQLNVPQGMTTVSALAPAGSNWSTGEIYPLPGGAFPNPWVINVGGSTIDQLNFYFRTPDLPPVGFHSSASSVAENAGEAVIPISVLRAFGTRLNVTVKIGADGSGRFGRDHYQTGLAFGFPAIDVNNPPTNVIQQTYNLRVPLIDNAIVDGDRTLVLYLVIGQVTYAPTLLVHTLTLVDDDYTEDIFRNGFETAP
ncbi:MAG: carboxypeptidase regulatory-like domain-containing protein [Rhodanobacteraceae bacterium]|nr:carboxypeptidase regulatory-like domain-containing protein [Rhodanobacteraceae bacterium]